MNKKKWIKLGLTVLLAFSLTVVPKETKMTKISIIIPCIRNILSSR